jgi:GNAT superfamily N-acetyltransferase
VSIERLRELIPASRRRRAAAIVLQDNWATLNLAPPATIMLEAPILVRHPPSRAPSDPRIQQVHNETGLCAFERCLIEAFPFPVLQPWTAGILWDSRVLGSAQLRLYLANIDDACVGTAVAFDDDSGYRGVYYVSVLPPCRRRGIGAALTEAAAGARRPAVLAATSAGLPLYEALGFRRSGNLRWWALPDTEPAATPVAVFTSATEPRRRAGTHSEDE